VIVRELHSNLPRLRAQGHAQADFAAALCHAVTQHSGITKADIRHNRGNAAERLGFLRRIIHGHDPRVWLKELKRCLGEVVDCSEVFG
jgi:hypothetical protein